MIREHRQFVVLFVNNKWSVFYLKEKVSTEFKSRLEAEEYKKYLMSR